MYGTLKMLRKLFSHPGGGSTTIAPVHDGFVWQKAVATSPIGGEFLTDCLMKSLEWKGITESPQAARVKVLASGNATERRFSVWIGGSILASLGSFQQMWFSKSEYDDHGAPYQRKCP